MIAIASACGGSEVRGGRLDRENVSAQEVGFALRFDVTHVNGDSPSATTGECRRIRPDNYLRDLTEFPVRFAAEPALGTLPPVTLASESSASPSLEE